MASCATLVVFLLAAVVASGDALDVRGVNPVTKVVKLLVEMSKQVETERDEDQDVYDKMACWCETNDREKTEAIQIAEKRIDDLVAAIDQGTAKAAELESEIASLKEEIQVNQDAIDKAMAIREKEKTEFEAEEADMSDSASALKEAIQVLSKVQLVQDKSSLVQVKSLVARVSKAATAFDGVHGANYGPVMQKDLWDLMGSLPREDRVLTGLEQQQDEQPTGAAAGAKSYNSRSGQILGMLAAMKESFDKNLATAQKTEIEAAIAFERVRSAKEGEMIAAGKALDEKTAALADTNQKVAQAKIDLEDTRAALAADQTFLEDLKKRCKIAADEFNGRMTTRNDEILAISETIKILTDDSARDLFSDTTSLGFLQIRKSPFTFSLAQTTTRQQQRGMAASKLLALSKQQRMTSVGWRLATLAVGVQLDGFEKVKQMIDKMIVDLKKQQGQEYEKHEACKNDIGSNERDSRGKNSEKKDTTGTLLDLDATLAQLKQDLEDLAIQISETHVSLKAAGEERMAANHDFQQAVANQRATVTILHKALDRLKEFYAKGKESLLSVRKHSQAQPVPGAEVAPPPPAGKAYSHAGGSTGVMSFLEKIIQDATRADQEAVAGEQESQNAYSQFVANTNEVLDAANKANTEKTIAKEKAEADRLTAKKDLKAIETALEELAGTNQALHQSCDYLLKNYNIRQEGRQSEIEAIQEAKAILNGASLGGEE